VLPRDSLLTIYKAFVRPHLNYRDTIYDYPGNVSFSQRLESIQYNACLANTGCFRGTSREKLYSELGIERLVFFYKAFNSIVPQYLREILPPQNVALVILRSRTPPPPIYPLDARTERYQNSFFPYCISQ